MSDHKRMNAHVNRGLAWVGVASSLVGLLDIVAILVILNNWIDAEQYGIATKCIWIFPILDQVTDLGLSAAVIQRDDHSEDRISTVFWINVSIAVLVLGILAGVAPFVATRFYGHAIVGWMLVAYGGKVVLHSSCFISTAMLRRELRYKDLSIIRILANVVDAVAKIGFAAGGFGIWCFVLGPICRTLVYVVGTQACHPYAPKLVLRIHDAREYIAFGLRASFSQILFHFYTNVDYPIVGYFFGDVALGLYRLAYEVVLEPVRMISNVVVDIAFPAFARLRLSRERLTAQFISFAKLNIITVMTYSAIVMVVAPELILMLFPGFSDAIAAIRILSAVGVLRAVGFVVPPLLDGVGRPERTLKYMAIAAVPMPLSFVGSSFVFGNRLGFPSVPGGWAAAYPLAFAVLIYMALRTLDLSTGTFLRAIGGVVACIGAAGAVGAAVHLALRGLAGSTRLFATISVILLGVGWLLAYTQGLSMRAALRALRDSPKESAAATNED